VQGNSIKESVLDTVSDLVGMVEWRARKPWIIQEMISKTDYRRKKKNVNNEKGGRNTEEWKRMEKSYRKGQERVT
jgi:hypothetical protein